MPATVNTILLRKLIRVLERMERHWATCPLQQCEHSVGPDEASNQNSKEKPMPVITVRAITELGDAEARQRKAEYQSADSFQKESLSLQWWLFIATMLAFGAAAYYAWIAKQQFVVMNDTLQETHIQNVAQQRALLSVDGNAIPLRGGDIGIRIKNQGHMAGKIVACQMNYEQFRSKSTSLVRRKEQPIDSIIAAEDTFILSFTPPQIPPLAKGENVYIRLDIRLSYDDGFGTIQHTSQCLAYNTTQDVWENSCMTTYGIDLSKRLPTDIWLPRENKK